MQERYTCMLQSPLHPEFDMHVLKYKHSGSLKLMMVSSQLDLINIQIAHYFKALMLDK
jgi:hypothetical protein